MLGERASVSYLVGATKVWDFFDTDPNGGLVRTVTVDGHKEVLTLVLGELPDGGNVSATEGVKLRKAGAAWLAVFSPDEETRTFHIGVDANLESWLAAKEERVASAKEGGASASEKGVSVKARYSPLQTRWPEVVTTTGQLSDEDAGLIRDDVTLPLPNPWKRNVRLSGFDFFLGRPSGAVHF